MTFHSLSIFCHSRVLSLTQLHTLQHRQELLLWLFYFELFQNFIKVCTHWKILSSVLIYQYRTWCSMCKQVHRGLSLKNSFQTLLYALQNNSTLFLINNMSFTNTYQKGCSAPTHFLVKYRLHRKSVQNYMLWSTHQSVYSNSEMLAPVHWWIARACTLR